MRFGLDHAVIDQRLLEDSGADSRSLAAGEPLEPALLAKVFGSNGYADRRTDVLDPYVHYLIINAARVPLLAHRQAIAAAVDRSRLRRVAGGHYAGDLADGVIKPSLGLDYAPSGLWDGLLGAPVPDTGDPQLARRLIRHSGVPVSSLRYDYPQSSTEDKAAAALIASLAEAGITVIPNPIPADEFGGIVFDPETEGDLVFAQWGPDWANASTIIPELFASAGGFNLSHASDPTFDAEVATALGLTDRVAQAHQWRRLNREAMAHAWVVPTRFSREQRLAGSQVRSASGRDGRVYVWAPWGAWPYADLYVTS
jgi:peptide/nickel transport system substrate-binding protein